MIQGPPSTHPSAAKTTQDKASAESGDSPWGAPAISPIKLAIADKNPLVLVGLKALLNENPRFTVVWTSGDGESFVNAVGRVPFDIGIIGWNLPLMDGRQVLEALGKRASSPRIVVYSSTNDRNASAETLRLGGFAYVSKRQSPDRLLEVLATVAMGECVFPEADPRKAPPSPLDGLTRRERDLLALLSSGQTNAELAGVCGVSINTVKFHLRNLFEKLQLRNRAQAVSLYLDLEAKR